MALATVGALALALMFAVAVAAPAGRRRALRLRARGVRQPGRLLPTPGSTGSPPGPATRRSSSAGCSTSRSSSTRAQNKLFSIVIALVGLWIPAAINLTGVRNMGAVQLWTVDPEVRPARLHVDGRAVLHRAARNFTPGTPAATAAVGAIGGAMAICLFSYLGVETAAVAAGKVRDPDKQRPAGHDLRHPRQRRRVPAVADRGLRHRAGRDARSDVNQAPFATAVNADLRRHLGRLPDVGARRASPASVR